MYGSHLVATTMAKADNILYLAGTGHDFSFHIRSPVFLGSVTSKKGFLQLALSDIAYCCFSADLRHRR